MALTETDLTELRQRMLERSKFLEGEIAGKLGDTAHDFDALGRVGDSGDFAWAEAESGLDLAEALRDIEEWRGLREAMRRMAEGNYGVCVDCGAEIPVERLRSQPLALRCVDCQTRAERMSPQRHSSI